MSKLYNPFLNINCAGQNFQVSFETLEKLSLFKEELKKWNLKATINLDRNPKYFAAMLDFLRGYPLNEKKTQMAKHELTYFNYDSNIASKETTNFNKKSLIDETSEDVTFAVQITYPHGSWPQETCTVKKETLDMLPGLRSLIASSTIRSRGLSVIKIDPETLDAVRDLQQSMASGKSLRLEQWHNLSKHYQAKEWDKLTFLDWRPKILVNVSITKHSS